MSMNRREFLAGSALGTAGLVMAAGGVVSGLSAMASARSGLDKAGSGPLKILILGGTGFLGPAVIESAKKRGYSITLFNRGRTEKRKPGQFDGEDKIFGNRDPDKYAGTKVVDGREVDDESSVKGLSELEKAVKEGRTWDGVIDTSGYFPRHAKASAEVLAKATKHYVFISTVSVYPDNDKPGADESAPVGTVTDPENEQFGADMSRYGPLKAACEAEVEKVFPGRASNIRAGFIVGPNDTSDRFTYWPLRAQRGGEFLVPGSESDPVQIIDVRDLADFALHCIEKNIAGVFNALGPAKVLTNKDVIDACVASGKAHGGPGSTPVYIPYEFLGSNGVPAGALPILLPNAGDFAGFHTRSNAKAVAAGLTFRPVRDTVDAILEWWPKEQERRITVSAKMMEDAKASGRNLQMPDPKVLRAGIPAEAEAKVLEAWKSKKG